MGSLEDLGWDEAWDAAWAGVADAAATVPARVSAVDPHAALIVHGAEMQQDALASPCRRNLELPPLPQPLVRLQRFTGAGERRFHRERNQKLSVEPGWCGRGLGRDRIVPEPVQILPSVANELRPGIFTPGIRWRDLLAPGRFQRYGGGFPGLGGGRQGQ